MISAKNLCKYFGLVKAVDDVSFEIGEGEIVGFLGPNGAGKTTTMRVLTCFIPPSKGSVSVAGHDVFNEPLEVRQTVGYLPENVPMYPEMRVIEYLDFRGRLKGLKRKERKNNIAECMERCGVNEVKNKIISQISKGFRQRVGLAESLLGTPKILILDEPTVGLDPNQIKQVRQLIKELGKDHTILLSTHILPEVEMVCERFMIIHEGKIVESSTMESIMGDVSLYIEIKGAMQEIADRVGRVDGVSGVISSEPGEFNIVRFGIQRGKDPREAVFSVVKENGWIMRELRLERPKLEDIFIKATQQGR